MLIAIAGCQPTTEPKRNEGAGTAIHLGSPTKESSDSKSDLPRELAALRAERKNDQLAEAIKRTKDLLVRYPNDPSVIFEAAQTCLLSDETAQAIELLKIVTKESAYRDKASLLLITALRGTLPADGVLSELTALVSDQPGNVALRHEFWVELNRHGLRQEASRQVDFLCTMGQAKREQLISIIERNHCYPTVVPEGLKPEQYFESGLGMARWLHATGRTQEAIQEITRQQTDPPSNQTEHAFLGRLICEGQMYHEFSQWLSSCDQETQGASDFWAALGIFFIDQHEYEAATRALLEALLRDPTDERSAHRLARSLDALGRTEDAEQARNRAVLIVQLKDQAQLLYKQDQAALSMLEERLLELGRPFEVLNWKLQTTPDSAATRTYRQQLRQLSQNQDALSMAFEMSQIELSRIEFEIAPELLLSPEIQSMPSITASNSQNDQNAERFELKLLNRAKETGLNFQWYTDFKNDLTSIPLHEVMGGGVAVIDYQLDGWPDVYLAQGSGEPPNRQSSRSNQLFRNLEGSFQNATEISQTADHNYSSGIAAGDVNQDGFPDLWVGNLGKNRLLINNGDGTFRDDTESLKISNNLFTASVAIADLNGDHLPDLYEAAYVEMEDGFRLPEKNPSGQEVAPSPLSFYASPDRWLENRGDGRWIPHMILADQIEPGTGLGLLISDFDQDGRNEVFVANDGRANHWLRFNSDGSISNLADLSGLAAGFDGGFSACMGVASGDFDHDGRLDLHVSNFSEQSNHHFLQLKPSLFTDLAIQHQHATWSSPYVGFGIKALDLDRNGWLDLIATNGHIFDLKDRDQPFKMPGQLIMNHSDHFQSVNVKTLGDYWESEHIGRSVTKIDFNQDQKIDFLISHLDDPLALLENQSIADGNWIQIELIGIHSEREAVGTQVEIYAGDQQWTEWVTAGDGYLASDQKLIDIGMGSVSIIDQLVVRWTTGVVQKWQNVLPCQRLLIIENQKDDPLSR